MATAEVSGFTNAKQIWDARENAAQHWRRQAKSAQTVAAVALLVIGVLVVLLVVTGRNRIVPYVIATNQMGQVIAAGYPQTQHASEAAEKATLYDWIEKWRFVTSDPTVQDAAMNEVVYSHIADTSNARGEINEWYAANPPRERVKQGIVTVEVRNVLRTGANNYEAEWIERGWANGGLKGVERWKGSFTVARSQSTDEKIALHNPFGLYVIEASWSQIVEGEKR